MRAGIIGGGTMGIGIAHRFAVNGAQTTIVDVDIEKAREAVHRTADTIRAGEKRRKISSATAERAIGSLEAAGSVESLDTGLDVADDDLKVRVGHLGAKRFQ